MPFFRLAPGSLAFPPPHLAGPDGLLAIGGDFSPERLVAAYAKGIFPWLVYSGEPVWFSPDPRMVLKPRDLDVPRSLAKVIRRAPFTLTMDTAFADVVASCAEIKRTGQRGSWITPAYAEGFLALHAKGIAHSVEAWQDGQLVGGLYGMALGSAFFGESMFARRPDASKVAFATFVRQLDLWGFQMIDCQQVTDHLARFGGKALPRTEFVASLERAVARPSDGTTGTGLIGWSRVGPWRFELKDWDGRVPPPDGPEPG